MGDSGVVEGGRLTDQITRGVLAASVPRDAVDDAVAAAGRQARRRDGKLPPHVMVYFAMAMALFASVILSFGVSRVRDLGHRVADSVVDAMAPALSGVFTGLDRYRIGSGLSAGRRAPGRAGGAAWRSRRRAPGCSGGLR